MTTTMRSPSPGTTAAPATGGAAGFLNLVLAELTRLRSRRMVVMAVLVVVLLAGLYQVSVGFSVQQPSAADLAQGQADYQAELKNYESSPENKAGEQECLDSGGSAADCDFAPKLEWFVQQATPFTDIAPIGTLLMTVLVGLAVFLAGSSFIGAEFSSGSVSNWLTFVPQRGRVLAAKLIALALGSGLLALVVLGGSLAMTAILTTANDGDVVKVGTEIGSVLRATGLVVAIALIGFCVALLTRHTAAALGVLLGYGLLSIVANIFYYSIPSTQKIRSLLPDYNLQAFLSPKGYSYQDYYPGTQPDGSDSRSVEQVISLAHGGVFWLVLVAVFVVAAFVVFRRRDVG